METWTDAKQRKWHSLDGENAIQTLETSPRGLDKATAEKRLASHGPNALPETAKVSGLVRFLRQFHNVLIYVLLLAAVATAFMQHWVDTGVILGVVVINAIIGFLQEGKAERALDGIRNMLSLTATVEREGKRMEVPAESLVPGDVVHLESGDKVPADLRLIKVRSLKVEESALTGESVAVEKHTETLPEDTGIGDRLNLAFSGTMVTYGRAVGVVTATGTDTELGKISEMMEGVTTLKTPLLQKMDHFGKLLSVAIGAITVLFFLIGFFFRDYAFADILLAVIGLAVAAIPEGLPAIMTITLALGVQRMAQRKAIIRRLPSVETLGAVTVICSDKTGTLTRNEMTVRTIVTSEETYQISGEGYHPDGAIEKSGEKVAAEDEGGLHELLHAVLLCNDASLKESEGQWTVQGDPTEGGLLALGPKANNFAPKHERLDTLPFESQHKYMATLNRGSHKHPEEGKTIWVKGAPERILERCKKQWCAQNETRELDRSFWDEQIEQIAKQGQRVLAAAFIPGADDHTEVSHDTLEGNLIFLGLIGMIDPPRPEAIEAVKACRSAGIRVKMITGDHAATASAIARELGLEAWEQPITGQELETMDAEALADAAQSCDVFARTSPENKLRLVEALQKRGEITAMTGDGVNDAPALKRSDIGIAMGIKGTEVTKDASEMVLADDNFATIARAVEEGRTIYANLRKAILFILPTNGAQALVVMLAILMGMDMPITPVQILWINMVTAVTLALAFSFEPPEGGVMKQPPRDPKAGILGTYFLWRIAFVSALLAGFSIGLHNHVLAIGGSAALATTMAVNTLAAGQVFYLFNCRSLRDSIFSQGLFSNPVVWWSVGSLVVLQLLFTYAGFMQNLFGTEALPANLWISILGVGLLVLVVIELEKWLMRKWRRS